MSEKRRDSKGRVLRNGESVRTDGKYCYKYIDQYGEPRFVYSWRLDVHDKVPSGKRAGLSLREKEKEIHEAMLNGVLLDGGGYTVYTLCEKYIKLKTGVRHNTEAGYLTVLNKLEKDPFGKRRIDKVRISDAKAYLINLQKEEGRSYSSVHTIRGVLRPAFQMAVEDDLIRKNPFDFELGKILVNDSEKRTALTPEQMELFLDFVRNDDHYSRYYEGVYILFNTGLRVSEFVGLTKKDIDFKEMRIIVDHQLQRTRRMTYVIEGTKTNAGTRMIPMTEEVAACFREILRKRKKPKVEPVIGGHAGFLYLDMNGKPMVGLHWEHYFKFMVEKYNKTHPTKLPKITPHICRHTFCSNMARSGMNPKSLQYIMGHSDISITLNVYTHFSFEDARREMAKNGTV